VKLEIFKDGLKRLSANMGKAIPIENVELMYNELSWIPDAAWGDLIQNALSRWDKWPRNFPMAVKQLWYDWQSKRRATFEGTDCDYCDSEGLLRQMEEGYEMTYACGHCDNWQKQFGSSLEWTDRDTHRRYRVKRLRLKEIPTGI